MVRVRYSLRERLLLIDNTQIIIMKYLFNMFLAFILAITGFATLSHTVHAESGSDTDDDDSSISTDDSNDDSDDDSDDDKGGLRPRGDKIREMEFKKEREDWKRALEASKDEFKIKREETKSTLTGLKDEFKAKRELLKAEYEKRSDEFKKKKEEMKKELHDKLGEVRGEIFTRFEIATERLTQIQDKLTTRIEAYTAEGKDMSSAKTLLDSSKSHLAKAKDLIAQAKAKIPTQTTQDTATVSGSSNSIDQALRDEIRALLKNAKEEMKLAHTDLRESFKAIIKVLVPEASDDSNNDSSGDDATGSNQ